MHIDRRGIALFALVVLSAGLFFASLERLWPLADIDVNAAPKQLIPQAGAFLRTQGLDVNGYDAASALRLDRFALDYVTRTFGMGTAQQLIRSGRPLYEYQIVFKKGGDPDAIWVDVHPKRGVIGWGRTVQEDASGAFLRVDEARAIAKPAALALGVSGIEEKGHTERDRPSRRDHVFVYESYLSRNPELRERISITVSGADLTAVQRQLVPPESARRDARKREAPVAALQMSSFILLGIAGLAAIVVFLTSLRQREVQLAPSARWVLIIAVCYAITRALRPFDLLWQWDPLWPRFIANLQTIGFSLAQGGWIALALFVVIAAGDALDRRSGAHRGRSLWRAGEGRFLDREIGIASGRGFLVGLLCGGALVATLLLLQWIAGAWVGIQPQGFFFFAINSSVPALSTLLYFFMVATVEETAYRFFAGAWLLSLTRKPWIAIAVPGILYGASHTGLDFLPPAEPFWGRAVALTVIGCVWGWAFLRYDALTVILSHFTADLFVFNWPRLGSGDPILMAKAIAVMCVPLVPALLLLGRRTPADHAT